MTHIQFIILSSIAFGLFTGAIGTLFLIFRNKDGVLGVDRSDPEKDRYNFIVLCPLDELPKKRYLIVEVKEGRNDR